MDLFIVRHAWAGEPGDPQWADDSLRPLSDEGRSRFVQMVKDLVDRGLKPQLIATSPMVRCVQTAELLAEPSGGRVEVVQREELLPGGDAGRLLAWTDKQARRYPRIAWVGHAPYVGRLAAVAIGESGAVIRFGKGAVAAIRFEDEVRSGAGELRWLVTAKVLGR